LRKFAGHVERQRHETPEECRVVGQGRAVLFLAPEHDLVLLGGREAARGRHVLGGVDHRVRPERVAVEVAEHPVLVRAGAARSLRIRVVEVGAVRRAVAGESQRDVGHAGLDLLRGGEQDAHAVAQGMIVGPATLPAPAMPASHGMP
jgi:hypothetical protein